MATSLLNIIYQNGDDLVTSVQALLDAGHDPNLVTEYSESPLRVASNNGRFEVVKLLLSNGADSSQLGWTNIFHDIAFGSLEDLEATVAAAANLECREFWSRTPLLFAILVGDIEKVELLLKAGADASAVGHCGRTPLSYAIQNDNAVLLSWLIQYGFSIDQTDDFGDTPSIAAAKHGAVECLKLLISRGADIHKANSIPSPPIEVASNLAVVYTLLEAGADINDMSKELRAEMLGYRNGEAPDISKEEYLAGKKRTFGKSNPELSTNAFWHAMVRCGGSGYHAASKFEQHRDLSSSEPVWSFDRFGKSITPLKDGRFIEIAGEHEDHYDPDFCIYNDVFVHSGNGECSIYTYPREAFSPTDFHTATLVGEHIYIIGNLGYGEDRQPGYTPVYRLDIHTMRIDRIVTHGAMPGWISRHKAHYKEESIVVKGGKLIVSNEGKEDYVDNEADYALSLKSMTWRKLRV